jgi:hypothetical protein
MEMVIENTNVPETIRFDIGGRIFVAGCSLIAKFPETMLLRGISELRKHQRLIQAVRNLFLLIVTGNDLVMF